MSVRKPHDFRNLKHFRGRTGGDMKGSTAIGILVGTCAAAALTAAAAVRLFPDAHPVVGPIVGAAWGAIGLVLLEIHKRRSRGE